MFDHLMCLSNVIQGETLGNANSRPTRLKCLIYRVGGIDLCFRRDIIAANKEYSCVAKDERLERYFWRENIRRVSGDGTAL
jgi:hypothetical protein